MIHRMGILRSGQFFDRPEAAEPSTKLKRLLAAIRLWELKNGYRR